MSLALDSLASESSGCNSFGQHILQRALYCVGQGSLSSTESDTLNLTHGHALDFKCNLANLRPLE